jgi:hypothetical protein
LAGADGKEEEEKNRVCRGLSGSVWGGATTSVIERRFACWPLAAESMRQTLLARNREKLEVTVRNQRDRWARRIRVRTFGNGDKGYGPHRVDKIVEVGQYIRNTSDK